MKHIYKVNSSDNMERTKSYRLPALPKKAGGATKEPSTTQYIPSGIRAYNKQVCVQNKAEANYLRKRRSCIDHSKQFILDDFERSRKAILKKLDNYKVAKNSSQQNSYELSGKVNDYYIHDRYSLPTLQQKPGPVELMAFKDLTDKMIDLVTRSKSSLPKVDANLHYHQMFRSGRSGKNIWPC